MSKNDEFLIPTSRGDRRVSRDDLGLAIDALASRMADAADNWGEPTKDDVADANLLLRINPDYADITGPILAKPEELDEEANP